VDILVVAGPAEVAIVVADAVERLLCAAPDAVLGLCTGASPMPTYRELARRHREGRLTFRAAQAFLLDEYVGIGPDSPQSFFAFIQRELIGHVDFSSEAVHALNGLAPDLAREANRYEEAIASAGGIDLQLLGIGRDGHLGFNEPGSPLGSRTRTTLLATSTRQDNAQYFKGDITQVPHRALTQGLGTILDARRLLLVATGEGKAPIIARALSGPLTTIVPASALRLHPDALVVLDEAAATELRFPTHLRQGHGLAQPGAPL
jgi:glucosamine-6-phosphate deaminase